MENSKYFIQFLMLIITLIFISSCSLNFVPKGSVAIGPELIEKRMIPYNISDGKTISIVNAQEARSDFFMFKGGFGHRWFTNLNEVTNNLIKNLSNEYKKRGVNINSTESKKLNISVDNVVAKFTTWSSFVFIYVSIKSSDGKINKNIIQKGEAYGDFKSAFKRAIRNAVIYILIDEEITVFINS